LLTQQKAADLNARQTLPFRAGKDSTDAEGIHGGPCKAFVATRWSAQYCSGDYFVAKLRLDPKNAVYRDLLASVFSITGQHAQAIEILGALVAEPNARYAEWLNYVHELKTAGRSQESIAAYRRAMALDPGRAHHHCL
jgi:tetratricopeptide (TPR) repeat protein